MAAKRMSAEQRARKQARDRAYRARKKADAIAKGQPLAVAYGHSKRLKARSRKPPPFRRDFNTPAGDAVGALAVIHSTDRARIVKTLRGFPGSFVQINVTFEAQRELQPGQWSDPKPMSRKLYGGVSRAQYPVIVTDPTPIGKVTFGVFRGGEGIPVADVIDAGARGLWANVADQFEREAD